MGKVFGPWTLSYHLFGVENFLAAILLERETVKIVLRVLSEVTVQFGNAQAHFRHFVHGFLFFIRGSCKN
jgi:[methyl-Co(III) methanol-specific corrinoid protein]:coenzyme M methyltransferase